MKNHENQIDTTNLTYRQLKELVPEALRVKMTAKKLENEEVLFSEHVDGAKITIFKSGYLTYTVIDDYGKPHSTVYSVHRCKQIIFPVSFSEDERKDAWDYSALADAISYRMIDGKLTKLHIIKEDRYLDGPWWMPICVICEERMRHNQSSREEYKSEFSYDGGSVNEDGEETDEVWNPELGYDPIEDWIEEQDKKERDAENHRKLMEGMKSLTEIQRRTVDLYYSNPGITERALAKELGVDQSTVHRNLQAALKNLRKFF
jgi:RNA polymerase sigma factor (sigma-70 family)